MSRLKKFFTKNVFWKLFSLIAAIILWFVVINIENPIETRSYAAKLTLLNIDELSHQNLVLTNQAALESKWISIKLRGARMALDKLHLRSDTIQASVDFRVLYGFNANSPISVPVDIKLPYIGESIETLSREPAYVDVYTERVSTIQKQVTVVVSGTPADGYVALLPESNPGSIEITGALSSLNTIDAIRAYVDVTDANKDVELSCEVKIYDAFENEVLNLSKNMERINVKVPINKYNRVPVRPTSQGLPAEGYTLDNITVEPKYVEIVGTDEDIKSIREVVLQPIAIQDLSRNYETKQDLRALLPANISIKNGTPNEVTIKVTIKKLEIKEFILPVENINITGTAADVQYTISPEPIIVNLRGVSEIIEKITESDLICTLDASEYEEGTYTVPLNFTLPSGTTLIGEEPMVTLEIKSYLTIEEENESNELDELVETLSPDDIILPEEIE